MSDNALERSSIQARVIKSGRRNSQLQFALVGTTSEALLVSESFQSTNPPRREQAETAALEGLLQKIRDQGWQIIARPTDGPEWWAFRFARGDHEAIQREKEWAGLTPASTPPQSTASRTASPPEQEVAFVKKKRGCLGGCLGRVGALVLGVIGLIVVVAVIATVATNSPSDDAPPVNDQGAREAAGSDPTGAPRAKVNPASGGLGLTGSEWKAAYGNPIETEFSANVTSFAGAGGRVDHQGFSDDGQSIQFTINFEEPVALDVAQSVAEKYFPADTKLMREYSRPSLIQNVALYHSTWLGESMSGPWLDAEPGSFLAIYHWEGEGASTRIGSVLIGVSHNP